MNFPNPSIINITNYADDSTFHLADKSCPTIQEALIRKLAAIKDYLISNRLTINTTKNIPNVDYVETEALKDEVGPSRNDTEWYVLAGTGGNWEICTTPTDKILKKLVPWNIVAKIYQQRAEICYWMD